MACDVLSRSERSAHQAATCDWWPAPRLSATIKQWECPDSASRRAITIAEGAIVEVYVPQEENATPRSIRDLGFAAMWADRDDIPDSVSHVNRLRDNPCG
jgi:hypothetical protein